MSYLPPIEILIDGHSGERRPRDGPTHIKLPSNFTITYSANEGEWCTVRNSLVDPNEEGSTIYTLVQYLRTRCLHDKSIPSEKGDIFNATIIFKEGTEGLYMRYPNRMAEWARIAHGHASESERPTSMTNSCGQDLPSQDMGRWIPLLRAPGAPRGPITITLENIIIKLQQALSKLHNSSIQLPKDYPVDIYGVFCRGPNEETIGADREAEFMKDTLKYVTSTPPGGGSKKRRKKKEKKTYKKRKYKKNKLTKKQKITLGNLTLKNICLYAKKNKRKFKKKGANDFCKTILKR